MSFRIFKVDPQTQNGARQEVMLNNNRERVSWNQLDRWFIYVLGILCTIDLI